MKNRLLRSIAALAFVAAIGASATAAPLVYTKLTLINNWVKYSSNVRAPGVALDSSDIVHLHGGISLSSGLSNQPFLLPVGFRPNKPVYARINVYLGRAGMISIYPDGSVYVDATVDASDARAFTSLEGVSFSRN